MLDASDTIDEVAELFSRVPGVEVLGHDLSGAIGTFRLSMRGAEAVLTVQDLTTAANVEAVPFVRRPEPASQLEQVLRASLRGEEMIELGNLQLLGIHLVWHLHLVGLLDADAANGYLRRWRGELVGA